MESISKFTLTRNVSLSKHRYEILLNGRLGRMSRKEALGA